MSSLLTVCCFKVRDNLLLQLHGLFMCAQKYFMKIAMIRNRDNSPHSVLCIHDGDSYEVRCYDIVNLIHMYIKFSCICIFMSRSFKNEHETQKHPTGLLLLKLKGC